MSVFALFDDILTATLTTIQEQVGYRFYDLDAATQRRIACTVLTAAIRRLNEEAEEG